MVNMQKMRNQFHRACGYRIGLEEYFNYKAKWILYYLVTTTTTDPPLKARTKNKS